MKDHTRIAAIENFRDLALSWARSGTHSREQLASMIEVQSNHIDELLEMLERRYDG